MTASFPSPRRLGMLLLASACNLGVWVLTGLFATSEFYRRSIAMGSSAQWNEVLAVQMVTALNWAALTPLVVFLAMRLPVRPPHRLRNLAAVIALLPLLAVVRAAVGGAVHSLGEGHSVSADFVLLSVRIRTHRNIAILAAIFFVIYLVDAQREAARRERQRMHAQTLLARTKIEELRSRLQPRFAVRMLGHIGSVLRAEPRAADALIVTLSGILRRSMERGGDERVRLGDELEHLDRCLELCRAGGRFPVDVRYVAGDDVLSRRVPALVLQPVIETVVLDLTSGAGGSVEVRCSGEEDETHIEVGWTRAPDGVTMKSTLHIPLEETAA
ncbi:MAG TPA: histidine kinase [Thermoanaerobaculia bacterium]|nr:histidine kinase [Thermoanaerobaculia bacterium]